MGVRAFLVVIVVDSELCGVGNLNDWQGMTVSCGSHTAALMISKPCHTISSVAQRMGSNRIIDF